MVSYFVTLVLVGSQLFALDTEHQLCGKTIQANAVWVYNSNTDQCVPVTKTWVFDKLRSQNFKATPPTDNF